MQALRRPLLMLVLLVLTSLSPMLTVRSESVDSIDEPTNTCDDGGRTLGTRCLDVECCDPY
jgi:hypothetical protein